MKLLKRYLGIVWMAMAPLAMFYLIKTALNEVASKPVLDTRIQWGVFVIVFLPIAIGLVIFGYYALKGEFDELPISSDQIK